MNPPERSLQQRRDALDRANSVRRLRAQLKRDLKAERVAIRPFISDPPVWIGNMKVFDLLLALPKHGQVKTTKIMQRCQMPPSKTVAGISIRQQKTLFGLLR